MEIPKHKEDDHGSEVCPFGSKTRDATKSLPGALKCCLLKFVMDGVEKVFVDRNRSKINSIFKQSRTFLFDYAKEWGSSSMGGCEGDEELASAKRKSGRNVTFQGNNREKATKDREENSASERYSDEVVGLNFLAFISVFLIKLMGFQLNLLLNFFAFPICFSFKLLMFAVKTTRLVRGYLMKKIMTVLRMGTGRVREKAQKSMRNMGFRIGFGLLWSSYVFLMLLGLVTLGFMFGGLVMKKVVEKPIQETDIPLNFDYTETSPVAYVPIMPYSGAGDSSVVVSKQLEARLIPHNHRLQVTVSLTLPESDYNRKLGIFQVRVEFISTTGKITARSSHPCMLRFKSRTIRIFETVIQSAPVIAGYKSESQTLNIKMNEFIGVEPTAYLKVALESRAEYKSGAGIPEIYKASLSLESDLPSLRRFIWHWRKTIFVWTSIVMFLTELMFLLVCCRPVIVPRGRPMIDYMKNEHLNRHLLD